MTYGGTAGTQGLDALLPPEMAGRAEETGVSEAPMNARGALALAVLAGGVIPS